MKTKIEGLEFDSYVLSPNDYFFDITPLHISLMNAVVEGDRYKEKLITKALRGGEVFGEPEDFTLAAGVTTNMLLKAIQDNDREEHDRLINVVRQKLKE